MAGLRDSCVIDRAKERPHIFFMSPTDAYQFIMRSRRALAGLKTVGLVFENPLETARLVEAELLSLNQIVERDPHNAEVVAGLLTVWQRVHDELVT